MAKNWNAQIQFPTDSNYVNRIISVDFGESRSSGNPMITLETEVVSPAEVEVAGEMVNIAGVKAKNYYSVKVMDGDQVDEEKTANARERAADLLTLLGLEEPFNWDNLKPQLEPLRGKLILTMMEPEVEERSKTPTQSQIEDGIRKGLKRTQIKGDIMKHPVTGKALINYWPKVREIFGLAPQQDGVGVPY